MTCKKAPLRSLFLMSLSAGIALPSVHGFRVEAQSQGFPPPQSQQSGGAFTLPAPNSQQGVSSGTSPFVVPGGNSTTIVNTNVEARLQVYDVPIENVGEVGAKLQVQFGGDKRVRITNEPNTGRLMVLAPESTQRQIALVVDGVRRKIGSLSTDQRGNVIPATIQQNQYKLKRATWRELEDAIGRLAGPKLTITTMNNGELAQLKLVSKESVQEIMLVDRRNDEVRLQGTPTNVMAWTQVVTAIDVGQMDPARPTQIIPITPATPERIERALKLVKLASYQQGATGQAGQPGQAPGDEAVGAARMNGQAGDNDRAAAIGTPEGLSAGSGLIGDVDISFVPEMGLVIVKGSKKDVQRVLEVIDQIKKQSIETQPDIQLLLLKHVNSQALETIIRDLNEKVFSPRQGQISITALGQPNALLLIGRPEALSSIKELVEKLDQPLDPNSQLRVIRLINSSAVDAETLIKNFFGDPSTTTTTNNTTTTLNPRVKVVADYRTNSLIVQASPRDQAEVARLIQQIDTDSGSSEVEARVFPIKNVNAADLEPILQTAITGVATSTTTGNNNQQRQQQSSSTTSSNTTAPNSKLTVVPRDGGAVQGGILSGVVVTSTPGSNSLLVRAPGKSMPLIKALIEQLDVPPNVDARIKVFEVKNGDASSLATTLQTAFGIQTTQNNAQNANNAFGGLFGFQNLSALTGGGENSLVPLRIAPEIRTNSIIVSGSKSDLDVIEVLLLRLDEDNARQRLTEVIWLRNSSAVDVANAITNLVTNQRQIFTLAQQAQQQSGGVQGQGGQVFSVNERIDREVFAVAEPATNSLIVSAMPKYMPQIREVIERLDRQQPMISVDILVAEVTLDDSFDLGTEFGLQDSLLFDRNSATGGTLTSPGFNLGTPLGNTAATPNRRPNNVAGQGLSSFGVGRSNSTLGYGGLVLAAGNESVSMLFRALQDANRVQILSRPRLMTLDNNLGVVSVGAQVPRIQGSTLGVAGTQQSIADVPVGLIMQVQPRTNQDGLINMIVSINRSSLGPTETGIPIGVGANGDVIRSPIINQTLTQTRVTAYDGQTVVLSGLITKSRTTRSRRIPWLADIPIAGALFRFDSQSESRTELLVVMTPHLITSNDEEKLEMIKQVESSRMSYCLADVLNIHGDVGLSPGNGLWGPAASPVIYPDVNPTVDRGSSMQPTEVILGDPGVTSGVDGYEGFQGNLPVQTNGIGNRTLLSPSGQTEGTVNTATPIQNSSYVPVNQAGGGVTPASYQNASPPRARIAGR